MALPMQAPTVKFETACFHPNVDQYGNICLDILKDKWSAAYSVKSILLSIQSLLGGEPPQPHISRVPPSLAHLPCRPRSTAEPNIDSPLNSYAAGLWDNQEEYRKVAKRKYMEATGSA